MKNQNEENDLNSDHSDLQNENQQLQQNLYKKISSYLGQRLKIKQIQIENNQYILTILIKSFKNSQKYIFLSHGFGGSSLMFFPLIRFLLQYGNVVLFQLRGMGFSRKKNIYNIQNICSFFIRSLTAVLEQYKAKDIRFIGHSFSGYLALMLASSSNRLSSLIKKMILLSPIGVTSPQEDYRSRITSFSGCLDAIINKIGWTFKLTFKSALRTCFCCCRQSIVRKALSKGNSLNQIERMLMADIIQGLVSVPDGSENAFFTLFRPRVLPTIPVVFKQPPTFALHFVFGGKDDWVDKTGARRLAQQHSNVTITVMEEYGHMLLWQAKEIIPVLEELLE